jgi:hypothetical protein
MQVDEMRLIQSSCRTSTKKPVRMTLKAMQIANAIIAGLKSNAALSASVDQEGHRRQI